MTGRTNIPGDGDPRLGEETLLALIEGELSGAREREVLAALAERPELLRRVRAMRRDKVLLSDLCDVDAPPEVMAGIESALERAALLDGPSFEELPPAPVAVRARAGQRRWSGALAMAAAVALLAGGIGYVALSRGGGAGRSAPGPVAATTPSTGAERAAPTLLAKNDQPDKAAETESGAKRESADEDVPVTVAMNDTTERAPDGAVANAAVPEGVPVIEGPPAPEALRRWADAPDEERGPITLERAMELAAQGRLVVRVAADSPARARTAMDGRTGEAWHACAAGTGECSRSAVGRLAEQADRRAAAAESQRTLVAARSIGDLRVIENRHAPALGAEERWVNVELTPEAMAALRDALAGAGRVTFEELDDAVVAPAEVKAENIIWWEQTPEEWLARADVPIVIETAE